MVEQMKGVRFLAAGEGIGKEFVKD